MDRKRRIILETHPNGYGLTVGEHSYLYFDIPTLLEGFFTHVGLGIGSYMDKDVMHNLLTVCATWPNEGDAIKAAADLTSQIETLQQQLMSKNNTIRAQKEKIERLQEEVSKVPDAKSRQTGHFTKQELNELNLKPAPKQPAPTPKPSRPKAKLNRIKYTDEAYKAVMTPIKESGLPTRVKSILTIVGGRENKLMGDALQCSEAEFSQAKGCGKFVIDTINKWCEEHSVCLNLDVDYILMKHAKSSKT